MAVRGAIVALERILVSPLSDLEDINFATLTLVHEKCGGPPMVVRRSLASVQWSLKCRCGFEVMVDDLSVSQYQLVKIGIGGGSVFLDKASWSSTGALSIEAIEA